MFQFVNSQASKVVPTCPAVVSNGPARNLDFSQKSNKLLVEIDKWSRNRYCNAIKRKPFTIAKAK